MVTYKSRSPGFTGSRSDHWTRHVALGCAVLVALGGLVVSGVSGRTKPTGGSAVWGLADGYAGVNLADVYHRGVRAVLLEVSWAEAEPGLGRFDNAYLEQLVAQARSYRSMGFKVALNYGLESAPGWLMARPGARYVNQYGTSYTAYPLADLIFDTSLRSIAEAYTPAPGSWSTAQWSTTRQRLTSSAGWPPRITSHWPGKTGGSTDRRQ